MSDVTQNVFKLWEPLEGTRLLFYCEGLHDDWEGFRILLRSNDRVLRVSFNAHVAYRNMDEGKRLKTLSQFPRDILGVTFYTVENSTWAKWFYEESKVYDGDELTHYMIGTDNDWIDVLALEPPIVEWL